MEEFLAKLEPADVASLCMSALALMAGALSTFITLNAKRYEDQRQVRITVGDLAQKILALRGEDELLNVKALQGQEGTQEFIAARNANIRTQQTLVRLMIDMLADLKRPASAVEYEVLAYALTSSGEAAGDKYWRLAFDRSTGKAARVGILSQHAYTKMRFVNPADGERLFAQALDLVRNEPVHEGYVHESRGKALHAIGRLDEATAAFAEAEAAFRRIPDEGTRTGYLRNLDSARTMLGLGHVNRAAA